jgi:hypothetical protein
MFNVLKRVWKYEFKAATQELFARQIDEFRASHREYRSFKKVAEMAGIDPVLLSKLRKKNKAGEFGIKLRFKYLFPFLEKGIIDIHKLNLSNTDEEKWIVLLCDACVDEKLVLLFNEAFRKGINIPDIILHKK